MNASPGPDWTTSSTLRPTCRAMNPRIAKTTSPEKRLAPNSNFVKNSKLNQFRPNGNEFYCTPVVKINLSVRLKGIASPENMRLFKLFVLRQVSRKYAKFKTIELKRRLLLYV